jgi:putative ABC transport system substrate-binding protein
MWCSTVGCLVTLILSLLAAPLGAEVQQPKQVPRIGFLESSSAEDAKSRLAAFQQGLHELGYVEGKHIIIEYRSAEGQYERLPIFAADLLRLQVAVLVAAGAPAAHAAKNATSTIPIVFASVADPVGQGLVAGLAHPGGNLTGLSDFNTGLITKRLELLKDVVPAIVRVAVLWNPGNPSNLLQWHLTQAAAPALGVTLLPWEATGPDEIDRALAAISQERPGALLLIGDKMLSAHQRQIAEFAVKHRLPTIGTVRPWAEGGLLMSYGAIIPELFRRAATYVDKILKGATPADLPVEQPMRFELVINLKTAQALGLTIPPMLLFQADGVIK